jgi:hypothetical protein
MPTSLDKKLNAAEIYLEMGHSVKLFLLLLDDWRTGTGKGIG